MNNKSLVKLSNIVGIIAIIALIYWVFTFISIEVFGLKIFRENITETFYMSIFGILALMFGALIINVMFNLTRIAEKHNQDDNKVKKSSKKLWILFTLSFPVLFVFLLGGNFLTENKKEKMLIASAKSIIENDTAKANQLVNYSLTIEWAKKTEEILRIIAKTDKHFPHVDVIVADTLKNVFLRFDNNCTRYNDNNEYELYAKSRYIASTTKQERDYLSTVFFENNNEIRFSSRDGNYELFYPYRKNGKVIVLYFSDYQRYGKIGS